MTVLRETNYILSLQRNVQKYSTRLIVSKKLPAMRPREGYRLLGPGAGWVRLARSEAPRRYPRTLA